MVIYTNTRHWELGMVVLIVLFFVGCAETLPSNPKKLAASTNSVSLAEKILQRNARVNGAWSNPVTLGVESITGTAEAYVHGPMVYATGASQPFSVWRLHSDLDPVSGEFLQSKTVIRRQAGDISQWLDSLPMSVEDVGTSSFPQVIIDQANNSGYALWVNAGVVYLNQFDANVNAWGMPSQVGTGLWGELFLRADGSVTVVWVERANNLTQIHRRRYSAAMGWDELATLTRGTVGEALEVLAMDGVEISLDHFTIAWAENSAQGVTLWNASYQVANGWSVPMVVVNQDLPFIDEIPQLLLAYDETTQSHELAFTTVMATANSGMAYAATLTSEGWQPLETLDISSFPDARTEPVPRLAKNSQGHIAIVWNEFQQEISEIYFVVKSRQYQPALGWDGAVEVSARVFGGSASAEPSGFPVKFIDDINVTLDNNGKVSVVWLEKSLDRIELFANHHLPASAWSIPELIAETTEPDVHINAPGVLINNDGQSLVSWQQSIKTAIKTDYQLLLSEHIGAGTVVTPPPDTPPISGNPDTDPVIDWAAPEQIWSEAFASNIDSYIAGPDVSISNAGDAFVSIRKNSDFNWRNGGYASVDNAIYQWGQTSGWQLNSPLSSADAATSFIQVKWAETTNDAYAVWATDNNLYVAHQAPGAAWSTPVLAGVSNRTYKVIPLENGNSWVVWSAFDETGVVQMSVAEYIAGTGLQAVQTFNAETVTETAEPMLDSSGNIVVAWLASISNFGLPTQPVELRVNRFVPGSGWETPSSISLTEGLIADLDPFSSHLYMAPGLNESLVFIVSANTTSLGRLLMAARYQAADGWSAWENIDYNVALPDHFIDQPNIAYNGKGDVAIAWTEETRDNNGEKIYRVYSNHYLDIADPATNSHWMIPQRISLAASMNVESQPVIDMTADGQLVAAWADRVDNSSILYVNTRTAIAGWSEVAQQIVVYNAAIDGFVDSIGLDVSVNGMVKLAWRQRSREEFAFKHTVWVTEQSLSP